MKVLFRGIVMLCVFQLSFLSMPAHSQERDSSALGNHKILYGFNVGFTENHVDLYYTQGGSAHALEDGNHSLYAPGFRMAVIGEAPLGRYFSLRATPGVSLFSKDISVASDSYKVESVCGEVPVDVKFHSFRIGKVEPYVAVGLNYSFDFSSQHKDSDAGDIQPLNAHDLRYTCGLGLDWYTRYLKVGFEFKATHGLFSPGTGGSDLANPFYFHNGSTLSLGLNIEA